jgi:hypothetical protein
MSRSYKKHPGFYDRSPFMKGKANEKMRHYEDLPNGGAYKKVFEQYNIHDYMSHIWGAEDLRYADDKQSNPKTWVYLAPRKLKCFKELQKTEDYRRARNK